MIVYTGITRQLHATHLTMYDLTMEQPALLPTHGNSCRLLTELWHRWR